MATSTESRPEIELSVAGYEDDERVKLIQRAQWLRAAILGANDGLLSTTSLMLGVGAAKDDHWLMIVSGLAGALAGACSMAVGEFVSVSAQRDIERTTIDKCNPKSQNSKDKPQEAMPAEGDSAINGYVESSQHKAEHIFTPHQSPFMKVIARDRRDLRQDNNTEEMLPNPYKAAGASGLSFLCGSLVPLLSAMVFSVKKLRVVCIVVVTSIALVVFGGVGARFGGSPVRVSVVRVLVGGWVAMAVTYGLLKPLDRDHKGHEAD
ncbi:Vacuolar iron transporter2.1 [Sesamum alatum]|uniref:Vacuolar iron transporter n=1 Tax=Sesamum alatum TaxID=300844 RepID=A0AAE1YI07_9LAMI|nr:Vacuolar iron transporter2.1 [Sesamum alatum]